jgi:hypothetical protein
MTRHSSRHARRICSALVFTILVIPASGAGGSEEPESPGDFGADAAEHFVGLALECVHHEYPNKIAHVLNGPEDVGEPHELTPSFYGCYDWHSSVHGHWLLARAAHLFAEEPFAAEARAALDHSLEPERIDAEVAYLQGEGRATFERPYGLAWLLQLAHELRDWDDPDARRWAAALAPLEQEAARRFADWLPKLTYPIRTGEHSQTAFALGLVLDWAVTSGDSEMQTLVREKALAFHAGDTDCNLAYEPGGQDFLSPCLAEADLMRRVYPPDEFAVWLDAFLPDIPLGAVDPSAEPWLPVAIVTDRTDGKLAHLDGLNLSRAWMLEGILAGLPEDDPRRPTLNDAVARHREAGLSAVTGEHYEGGHWLGSFAMYLSSGAGLPGR